MKDKIKADEVKVLALSRDKMTTGRRNRPVPQLTCRGRLCSEFTPASVLCTNMGSDGQDAQWKCEADMPNGYRFGAIDVSCEGYNYPEDPYLLVGSCGLTYELEGPGQPHKSHSQQSQQAYRSPYSDYSTGATSSDVYGSSSSGSTFGTLVWWAAIAVLVYAVFRVWKGRAGRGGGGGGGGGFRPDPWNPPRGSPPPYTEPTGANCNTPAPGFGAAPAAQGPGFWSGLLGGGALGYMMGNRNQRHRAPPATYGGYRQGGLGSRYSAAAPQSPARSHSESQGSADGGGIRTAYGGTSRR